MKQGKPGVRIEFGKVMGPDFRRNLESLASQTKTVSRRVKANRERAGRNRKFPPSATSSGVGNDFISADARTKVNLTSQMVMEPGFTVANRR